VEKVLAVSHGLAAGAVLEASVIAARGNESTWRKDGAGRASNIPSSSASAGSVSDLSVAQMSCIRYAPSLDNVSYMPESSNGTWQKGLEHTSADILRVLVCPAPPIIEQQGVDIGKEKQRHQTGEITPPSEAGAWRGTQSQLSDMSSVPPSNERQGKDARGKGTLQHCSISKGACC
jgi:hypothetical protein